MSKMSDYKYKTRTHLGAIVAYTAFSTVFGLIVTSTIDLQI